MLESSSSTSSISGTKISTICALGEYVGDCQEVCDACCLRLREGEEEMISGMGVVIWDGRLESVIWDLDACLVIRLNHDSLLFIIRSPHEILGDVY